MTKALGLQAAGGDALGGEGGQHSLGAGFAQLLVVSGGAGVVGVAPHGQAQVGALLKQPPHFGQGGLRIGPQRGLISVKIEVERDVPFRY